MTLGVRPDLKDEGSGWEDLPVTLSNDVTSGDVRNKSGEKEPSARTRQAAQQ